MTVRRSARLSSSAVTEPNGVSPSNAKAASTATPKSRSKPAKSVGTARPVANSSAKRKTSKAAASPAGTDASPQTPKATKKRKVSEPSGPSSVMETEPVPSNVKMMAAPAESPVKTPRRGPPRRVDPHVTNALLKTPAGSRVAAYPADELFSETPSQQSAAAATTTSGVTTDNLLKTAEEHLIKMDPKLAPLIAQHQCKSFSPAGLAEEIDPFTSLVSSIVAQQVSGAAASSIKRRFVELFFPPPPEEASQTEGPPESKPAAKRPFPTPVQVAAKDIPTLRSAGLSQRKAEYIHGLAEKFVSGELSARMLVQASDEEVIEKLTAVRGLGKWSVEMFSCFSLKRMDIFSTGDLGVQRGMAVYVGRDVGKLKAKGGKWKYMSEQDMLDISDKFAPYRSLFMWYMWRIEDVDIEALAG